MSGKPQKIFHFPKVHMQQTGEINLCCVNGNLVHIGSVSCNSLAKRADQRRVHRCAMAFASPVVRWWWIFWSQCTEETNDIHFSIRFCLLNWPAGYRRSGGSKIQSQPAFSSELNCVGSGYVKANPDKLHVADCTLSISWMCLVAIQTPRSPIIMVIEANNIMGSANTNRRQAAPAWGEFFVQRGESTVQTTYRKNPEELPRINRARTMKPHRIFVTKDCYWNHMITI